MTTGCDVGGQMPAAAAAMMGNYGPLLTYTPAGHPAAYMSAAAGTILLAAAPSGSATPLCTVLLVSNLNEEVRVQFTLEPITNYYFAHGRSAKYCN